MKPWYASLVALFILLATLWLNQWAFENWLQRSYLNWYLKSGALIGIATSAVAMVWGDMREHAGLISANPADYLGSYLQLVGLPIFVFGSHLRGIKSSGERNSSLDMTLTLLFALLLTAVLSLWLLIVVPLQYFVYLICGAPGRLMSKSSRRVIAKLDSKKLALHEIDQDEKIPSGWWLASLSDKPVAMTGLFSSLFFLIIKTAIG